MADNITLTQKAYEHLHQGILGGMFAPGTVVSEAMLAGQLGISRTPVREAIRQLAIEGLVEQVPRYGTIVRSIDRRAIIELYEMREALESYAVCRAAECMSEPQLARLDALCTVLRQVGNRAQKLGLTELDDDLLRRFLAADMAFHLLIIRATDNSRIMKVIKETRTISRIFRMRRQRHNLEIVERAHESHSRIVDALRKRDSESARLLMLEHIQTSKRQTVEQYDTELLTHEKMQDIHFDLPADLQEELQLIEETRQREDGDNEEQAG